MTVAQLIAKLQKMPKTAKVVLADHDHGSYEYNGSLSNVSVVDYDDGGFEDQGIDECFKLSGKVVRLSV